MTKQAPAPAAGPRRVLRRDTQETRDRLLDATGELLAVHGPTFGLPELARHCGVSPATVYRHFESVHDAFGEYTLRLVEGLASKMQEESARLRGRRGFDAACERWAGEVSGWGRAATHVRSAEGFLERVRRGEPITATLYAALSAIVADLVESGILPRQDMDFAVLMWVTVFDERVLVDLYETQRWSSLKAARRLGAAVIGSLGG